MKFRNLISGFQLAILLSSALLIAVFGYLVFRTYHHRIDLSKGKVYSLSSQTLQILEAFKTEPIHVYAFFRDDQPKAVLENLLKEYAYRYRFFHYEFYDPDRMPAKTKEFQVDDYGTIVIEAKGHREKTKQVTEEAITNLLSRLLHQKAKRIIFDAKHGGPQMDDEKEKNGFGLLRKKLMDSNYEVKESVLMRGGIPKGTDLFLIGGPHMDLLPEELKVVRSYSAQGGSV